MPPRTSNLESPKRWEVPFGKMTDAEVDRLLTVPPFSKMDAKKFPDSLPLRGILKNDTRFCTYDPGEIILRQGDYGTSAFMVVSGQGRVSVCREMPARLLGRRESVRKGFFGALGQLFFHSREPERSAGKAGDDNQAAESTEPRIFLQDFPRLLDKFGTGVIAPGDFFGEIAALCRTPRSATVISNSKDCELLEIRWQGLRDLMRNDPELRKHIDEIYKERALASAVREIPIFRALPKEKLDKVLKAADFEIFGEYDWSGKYKKAVHSNGQRVQEPVIAMEGDYPNGVIFVKSGFARVSQKYGSSERTLNYLGAGQVYGLPEIAHNWRKPEERVALQYTLRAMGYAHVIMIPTDTMESLVFPGVSPEILPALVTTAEEPPPGAVLPESAAEKIGDEMLAFLTENRFLNGTATMMINLDRCTRCDDCVRACATAHDNNPRFLRHGPISDNLMVANACMHCADPVCMIGCPTGAIHRYEFGGQVIINPITCIGCETCANNCPYDAIRMVESRDKRGDVIRDKQNKPFIKATKCDLCVDQTTGPACQAACPHGALARVNLNDIDALANWLKR